MTILPCRNIATFASGPNGIVSSSSFFVVVPLSKAVDPDLVVAIVAGKQERGIRTRISIGIVELGTMEWRIGARMKVAMKGVDGLERKGRERGCRKDSDCHAMPCVHALVLRRLACTPAVTASRNTNEPVYRIDSSPPSPQSLPILPTHPSHSPSLPPCHTTISSPHKFPKSLSFLLSLLARMHGVEREGGRIEGGEKWLLIRRLVIRLHRIVPNGLEYERVVRTRCEMGEREGRGSVSARRRSLVMR